MNATTNENGKMLSIKEVCDREGLSPVYVRRMIQRGKIETTKVEIAKNTFKHLIAVEEVERWRKSLAGGNRRADGKSKFNLYATPEEIEALQKLLNENQVSIEIKRANKVKRQTEGTENV